jgi:hypothetical protein
MLRRVPDKVFRAGTICPAADRSSDALGTLGKLGYEAGQWPLWPGHRVLLANRIDGDGSVYIRVNYCSPVVLLRPVVSLIFVPGPPLTPHTHDSSCLPLDDAINIASDRTDVGPSRR